MNPMYPNPAPTNYEPTISVTPQPFSSRTNDGAVPTTTTTTTNSGNHTTTRLIRLSRLLDDPHSTTSSSNDEERDDVHSSSSSNDETNNGGNVDTDENMSNDNTSKSNQENTSNNDNNSKHQSNKERASQIQNFLICFEMLLFAIGHWCVFPAEEWKPDYRPPMNYAKPGFGISDFAQDISDIVGTATQRRRRRRQNYEPTDTESSHPPRNDIDDDEEDRASGDGGYTDGNSPIAVMYDDYNNNMAMDTDMTIHDNCSALSNFHHEDDVVVNVPLGDVITAPTATLYNDDNRPNHHHQQHLRAIT